MTPMDKREGIVECHCMANAHRYYTRTFTNQLGQIVHRVFYRCENCLSRIYRDYVPDLEKCERINVLDLISDKIKLKPQA